MGPGQQVTVVISPRERFGVAPRSLESVLARTPEGVPIVYVDAGSPPGVRRALEAIAETANRGSAERVVILRHDEALPPNRARNLGFERVGTPWVAFLDNDVFPEPGWLEALLACAEQTGASAVAPLTLFGPPEAPLIHMYDGDLRVAEEDGERVLHARHGLAKLPWDRAARPLPRCRMGFAEFHGVLLRSDALREIGGLDESLLSVCEHLDLALGLDATGGEVWCEPAAVIRYDDRSPLRVSDAGFFVQRWSDDWNRRSLEHFMAKWRLSDRGDHRRDVLGFASRHRAHAGLEGRRPPGSTSSAASQPYAQTNLQLYRQLADLGWDDAMLERVRAAYELALATVGGLVRSTGKPFVAHAVGTASVLAAHGAPVDVVLAGLLHGSYERGGHPLGRLRRRILRMRIEAAIGASVDRLVREYAETNAVLDALPTAPDAIEGIGLRRGLALWIRTANDVDETLDGGLAYSRKGSRSVHRRFEGLGDVSRWLGFEALVRELEQRDAGCADVQVAPSLIGRRRRSHAVVDLLRDVRGTGPVVGRAVRRRAKLSWREALRRARSSFGSAPAS